jgi:hypothetical protein
MSYQKQTVAEQLKELLTRLSPLIEEYTQRVCPPCTDVCCKQKHGVLLEKDIAYLTALDIAVPSHDKAHPPDAPCQFLGPGGCSRPRWQRAWKCTWYFCDPLLKAMNDGPPRTSRRISALVSAILVLRERL